MRLYPFQRDVIGEIEGFRGKAICALDMGLGKTIVALRYLADRKKWPALIVCPAVVKYHWEREAERLGLRTMVLEGTIPRQPPKNLKIVILNYDILRQWLPLLRGLNPAAVVLDECQALMSYGSLRTKASLALCRGVDCVLALSGTPLLNRPMELFNVLKLLRPNVFPFRRQFGERFCKPRWTPWGIKYDGVSHADELHSLLTRSCLIRRRKADVLDLPPKLREVIPVPIVRPDEYYQARDDFLDWLRRTDPKRIKGANKAEALVKIGYLLQLAARLKLKSVTDWINKWLAETDEKLVVFAVHRKMIEALARRCNAASVVVDGTVTGRARQAAVDRFQNDKTTRLLIGNIQAAGVGLTLTAANTVVFTELAWRPGDHVQAEDRCHRIGTTKTVFAFYLVAHSTIEEKLCRVLQEKQQVLSAVLDGDAGTGRLSVFDQLLRGMGRERPRLAP